MDAEAQAIVAEAVKLSTVLSYIEFESSALVEECNWHDVCKDLLLNTIKKLREAVNQPPLWYVTPDGSTKALEFGTSILRAHNAQHIQTLVHLLVLSRSYHHVRMSAHGIVMEAFPERKLAKLNHKDRAKTLRMHLMNQRPIEDGNSQTSVAVAPPATPSTPASASLHQVSEAELVALASIQESLREAYTNVLLDKSTAVELLLELDDGGRDIQRAQVLHIEAALVILMQAWIREHHHTRSTLERIFSATLSNNDDRKTLAYDEFVVTMGFLDATFTPARLTTIYVQATDGDSANDVGEASVDRLIDILYESDLFSETDAVAHAIGDTKELGRKH
ncbi:unnamed protein product [Aphanomyces euteiches]